MDKGKTETGNRKRKEPTFARPQVKDSTSAKRPLAVSDPHPDRDRELAVFTNFWFAAVRYQALNGWPDSELAKHLDVSDKTVAAWRKCIDATGVIAELIALIDHMPTEYHSGNLTKLRRELNDRMSAIQKESQHRAARKGANLPSVDAFERAVRAATPLLANFVAGFDARATRALARPSQASVAAAKKIAEDLRSAYRRERPVDLADIRADVLVQLAELSQAVARLSFLRANASFPGTHQVDPGLELEACSLAALIERKREEAKVSVRAYTGKVYRDIAAMDRLSDAMAFLSMHQAQFHTHETSDPMSTANLETEKQQHIKRLDLLVDHLARVYSPETRLR